MRHKRILEVAAEHPEASMAELAAEVPSATVDLVENILEQYGDPAQEIDDDQPDDRVDESIDGDAAAGDAEAMCDDADEPTDYPSPEELSEKQRETLRAIVRYPTAPQRELAEVLDITAATVSNRVNGIEGFEWDDRASFAEAVVDAETVGDEDTETTETMSSNGTALKSAVEDLEDRVSDLERQLESTENDCGLGDTDLTHKIVHACMDSETISQEEELQIIEAFVD